MKPKVNGPGRAVMAIVSDANLAVIRFHYTHAGCTIFKCCINIMSLQVY